MALFHSFWWLSSIPLYINTHRPFFHISLHPSVEGHLVCFHVLAIANSAIMNTEVLVSFRIMFFSTYMLRNVIAGSYGSSSFTFLRNLSTLLTGCKVVGIFAQCVCISNHQGVYFKYLIILSIIPPIKLEKDQKKKNNGHIPLSPGGQWRGNSADLGSERPVFRRINPWLAPRRCLWALEIPYFISMFLCLRPWAVLGQLDLPGPESE